MPAITSIVAKLLTLVDAFLENFATVSAYQSASDCNFKVVKASLTPCGQAVVAGWARQFAFEMIQRFSWGFWLGGIY